MRAITAAGLAGVTALTVVGLSAASSIGAATDGLSSQSMLAEARLDQAFSGGGRVPEDVDAPIRTGRWDPPTPPVMLAGGPQAAEAEASRSVAEAETAAPDVARRVAVAVLPQPSLVRSALQPRGDVALAGGPRLRVQVTTGRDALDMGSGLDAPELSPTSSFAPREPRASQPFDARRMLVSLDGGQDRKKGRWFIFAAGSGEALGLNLIRDPVQGWRKSGWSVERLAEFGKAQLGVGWRKGNRQVAVSAARREIGAYGVSKEDTVLGVTFTVSGQTQQRPRYEQRLPKR